ncbi:cation-transporting P-type ATPase [Streptomyces sp. XD-27]|uniref:cation-transporting P-type ATPase n=1 Tax=Streptomyces sp. XD-27 TaxID=3062779 RepID=UPI0026F44650|nr:cation-transporting P-type ATPase [Streptomyces sp. XD-27]WKX69020.1 cation-transporting P-type ATPase [Streptomyces sp. XD-27]
MDGAAVASLTRAVTVAGSSGRSGTGGLPSLSPRYSRRGPGAARLPPAGAVPTCPVGTAPGRDRFWRGRDTLRPSGHRRPVVGGERLGPDTATAAGLSQEEAERRLAVHGPNAVAAEPRTPTWRRVL